MEDTCEVQKLIKKWVKIAMKDSSKVKNSKKQWPLKCNFDTQS